ncbi:MAG: hypothetical protein MHPSP_004521, partial [Paramarteilia canceri]
MSDSSNDETISIKARKVLCRFSTYSNCALYLREKQEVVSIAKQNNLEAKFLHSKLFPVETKNNKILLRANTEAITVLIEILGVLCEVLMISFILKLLKNDRSRLQQAFVIFPHVSNATRAPGSLSNRYTIKIDEEKYLKSLSIYLERHGFAVHRVVTDSNGNE